MDAFVRFQGIMQSKIQSFVDASGPASLAPGQSTTVIVEFNNPSKTGITYTPRVLAGPGER